MFFLSRFDPLLMAELCDISSRPAVVIYEKPPKTTEQIISELALTVNQNESILEYAHDFGARKDPKLSSRSLRRKRSKHKSPWE